MKSFLTNNKKLFLLLACFFILKGFAFSKNLNEAETEKELKRINEMLKDMKNFKAPFIQKRVIPFFDDPLETKGICYFKQDNNIRWEIKGDYPSIMLHTEKGAKKFEKKDGKFEEKDLGRSDVISLVLKEISYWVKGDFSRAKRIYKISAQRTEKKLKIILTPKIEEMKNFILRIELIFPKDSPYVKEVRIIEASESKTIVLFTKVLPNIEMPSYIFDPENPLP